MENPFFAINAPLISRSQIFQFEALKPQEVRTLLERALRDEEHGLGAFNPTVTEEAMDYLVTTSDGDARRALTALEVAVLSHPHRQAATSGAITVDLQAAADSMQRKAILQFMILLAFITLCQYQE